MIRKLIARLAAYFAGQPMPKPKFIVWYQEPWKHRPRFYLNHDAGGYWYGTKKEFAHRFDTLQEAMLAKPVYDGSHYIERRAGIIEVYD